MSWSQRQEQQSNVLVTAQVLEERINMYISAMDSATAMDNGHQSSQLQQDIQKLVDLMERISAGQIVREQEVPPPLMINSQVDILANPLGELSSCLAEYHKALYFAEEELSEDRMNKIQRLQKGLQTIRDLQKRAQAGFPVRADEIPPRVTIPSDDEFDTDAINTLNSRLESFKVALSSASQSESDRRRIPKLQSAIRTAEFLLTRAKAKRPVWKKDIPPEFDYCVIDPVQTKSQPMNKAKFTLQLRSLQKRVQDINLKDKDQQKHFDELKKKLQDLETDLSEKSVFPELDSCLSILSKEVEKMENLAFAEKAKEIRNGKENLDLIEVRINEYKAAALSSKRDGQISNAIKHFKNIKGLLALKEALEKGEPVDMTLVPPPPRDFTPTSEAHPSFTELNQGIATPEAVHETVGANAQLTPVIIKPAVESAEDKLAKKLFSYLDKGFDCNLSTSKQIQNIHNISVSTAQCLPKVQNTEVKNEKMLHASINSAVVSNTGSEVNETDSSMVKIESQVKEVKGGSLLEGKESTLQQFYSSTDDQITDNSFNGVSENGSFPDNEQSQEGSENEMHLKDENNEETSHTTTSKPSPSKSSDIYSRKTLDTVGFLPCQIVPDNLTHSKVVVASSDALIVVNNDTCSGSCTLEHQESVEVKLTSEDHVHLPSHDFINSLIQPHHTTADTVHSLTNEAQNETLAIEQSSNTEILYFSQNARNEYSSSGPSSVAMPSPSPDVYSGDINNEPSSLPIPLLPKALEDHTSNNKDIDHSIPITHTPDISGLAESFDSTNTFPVSCSAGDFNLRLNNRKSQEIDSIFDVEINNSVKDLSISEATNSRQENNGVISLDELEFQDLIDSMAMPSVAAISSTSTNSSIVKPSSHYNEHLEPLLPSPYHNVLSQENASLSEASANSGTFVPSQQTSCMENNGSVIPSLVSSHSQSIVVENKVNTCSAANTNLSFPTEDVCTSNYISQQNTHAYPSASVSSLQDTLVTQIPDDNTLALGSRLPDQKSLNILNGGLSTMPASNPQLQSLQGKNIVQVSSSQLSVGLSKSINNSSSRPASVFAYSDVAFTCLENLKYDCLLNLVKGTDESKEEEKKLRAKFELIKNKLLNGGKRTWEVYRACVQREHASMVQQIEDLCLLQQWSEVQLLSEKKCIAERELTVLKERLPDLKY